MLYRQLLEKRGIGLHRRSSQMEVRNAQLDRMPSRSEELTQVEAMERQWDSWFSIPELGYSRARQSTSAGAFTSQKKGLKQPRKRRVPVYGVQNLESDRCADIRATNAFDCWFVCHVSAKLMIFVENQLLTDTNWRKR